MKRIVTIILTLLVFAACSNVDQRALNDIRATIITNKGKINVYLYPEGAPLTVLSFINLAERGYYDGLTFHRVVENFVIQGGDPLGNGTGGPGYKFKNEIATDWLNFYDSGMLAMANSGPDTNGSQFFITHRETPSLNGGYTVFGETKDDKDQKVVDKIEQGDIIETIIITGETEWLYKKYKSQVEEWNNILNENGFGDKRLEKQEVVETSTEE